MADGEQPKIRLDKFTAKVVPDPKNPGQSLCLQGFLGAAPDPAQTRLYWDASLSSFVDIDNADILHSEPLPKEQSPLGGSYLWVSTSAEVTASSAGGASAKGKFFEGPVTSTYGSAFAGGAAELRKQGMPTIGQWCTFTYCPVVAAPAAEPAAGAGAIGSYAPHCWYSWNACPTMYGCGPHRTPGCPMVEHAAPEPAIAGSYAPHCWYSWNACPTLYGCGPHNTPACPIVERPVGGGGGGWQGRMPPDAGTALMPVPRCMGAGRIAPLHAPWSSLPRHSPQLVLRMPPQVLPLQLPDPMRLTAGTAGMRARPCLVADPTTPRLVRWSNGPLAEVEAEASQAPMPRDAGTVLMPVRRCLGAAARITRRPVPFSRRQQ